MKAQLYYFDKKKNAQELVFDKLIRQAKFMTRANDSSKTLGNNKVRFLLASFVEMIDRSESGEICVDHGFISGITDCEPKQNTRLLAQLADIFEYKYHNFIKFEGKRKAYSYVIKYTETGIARLKNPEEFYPSLEGRKKVQKPKNQQAKKVLLSGQKCPLEESKMSASYISNKRDIKEVLVELPTGVHTNTQRENKNKEKGIDTSKDLLAACGAASLPPIIQQSEESNQAIGLASDEVSTTVTQPNPPLPTAEQEREQLRAHQTRQQATTQDIATPIAATILSLLPKLGLEANCVTKTHQKVVEFQPEVEDSSSNNTLKPLIEPKAETSTDTVIDDFLSRQAPWKSILRLAEEDEMQAPNPRTGLMEDATPQQKREIIQCQFGRLEHQTDLEVKRIILYPKGESWTNWFNTNFKEKFENYAAGIGYQIEVFKQTNPWSSL